MEALDLQIAKLNELSKTMVKQLNQYIKQHQEEIANVTKMVETLKKEKSMLSGEIQKPTTKTKKPTKATASSSISKVDSSALSSNGTKRTKSKPARSSVLAITGTPKASLSKIIPYSKTPKRFTNSMYKPNNVLSRSVSAASDLKSKLNPVLKSARP